MGNLNEKCGQVVGGEAALTVAGVSVQFGAIMALEDVSFSVDRNAVTALIGPNGAGKSTVINAICGTVRPLAAGKIFAGQDLTTESAAEIATAGIRRSFQHPPLVDDATVLENIAIGLHRTGNYSLFTQVFRPLRARRLESDAADRAMELLRRVALERLANRKVSDLPYGARKTIDILRAAVGGPKVLLLDEPTSGLDTHERRTIEDLLLSIRQANRTSIVIVEHHMEMVRALATSAVSLDAGRVQMIGAPDQVIESEELRLSRIAE